MANSPAMANWTVTYNNHASSTGAALATESDIHAAYYAAEGDLVEFKDSKHQVVFALQADIVLTIRRADAAAEHGSDA